MEVCKECYSKYFPVYKNIRFEISKELYKCIGCGKLKKTVKKVFVSNEVIDIN